MQARRSHSASPRLRLPGLAGRGVAAVLSLLVLSMSTNPDLKARPDSTAPPRGQAAPPADRQVDERVDALLAQMTLEEKIGQLNQLFSFQAGPDISALEGRIRKGEIGSLLFVTDPAMINRLQRVAVEESRLKIPLLFAFDVIHGFRTIFPVPLAMAASWDMALVEQGQTVAAREAHATGIRWTFAPMVDICRDARWGRIVEGAGEDPFLGSAVARAQVRGFQGPYVGSPERLLACPKHFAGYGAADGGRDYDAAYIPEVLLRNVYLPPFRAAIEAGAGSLMTAYQDLNDVPGTANRFLLDEVLRREWGFRGFVVSDAFSVGDLTTHGFTRDAPDAAARALAAGVNMDMGSQTYFGNVARLVEQGRLPVAAVDGAVRPILAAKVRLGLFERPFADEARASELLGAAEHRKAARVAAQRSAVLLRNEKGLLPLDASAGRLSSVAVVGPLADSKRDILGPWSFAGNAQEAVTVLEGLRSRLQPAVRVEHAQGAQIRRVYPSIFDLFFPGPKVEPWTDAQASEEIKKAADLAARSDVTVMVLGELESMNGEDASRATLGLPGRQQELLEAVVAAGKPVVLVLVNGRPLDISWAAERVPAILEVWHPGTEGGNAVADLLFGDAAPGGKLPVTWPRTIGQVPIYYNHNLTHKPETAPNFTSRYWDVATSPLFPFGYGLSYTTFAFANLRLSRPEVKAGESVEVTVDVENTGGRAGDVVAQLYVHQRAGSASRPVRELKGFERVALRPGEKRAVRFSLGKDELSFWSPQEKRWVQEAESFDLWVGEDSTATLRASLRVVP